MLLVDMVVRWSSTFVMLRRAYEHRQVCVESCAGRYDTHSIQDITEFLKQLSNLESDREKKVALIELEPTKAEWEEVCRFLELLEVRFYLS